MKRALKRIMSIALSLIMTLGLLASASIATNAADIQNGLPAISVGIGANSTPTVIAFGGKQWSVIGYNNGTTNSGVYSTVTNSMTLLLANAENNSYERTVFNPYTTPVNTYFNSYLYYAMKGAAETVPLQERGLINERDIPGGASNGDGTGAVAGIAVNDQLFWPLSVSEANDVNETVCILNNTYFGTTPHWWLRSPGNSDGQAVCIHVADGNPEFIRTVYSELVVRPAFNLNLSSVLFTSAASATSGKSSAAVGSGLFGTSAPTGVLKFTMSDGSTAPAVIFAGTTNGSSQLSFGFSGAATGTNQYLSCVLEDSSNQVAYYGKLFDCETQDNGNFTIDTTSLTAGTYTLKIFSEQANGDLYTDFASDTTDFNLVVGGGNDGTISIVIGGGDIDSALPTVSNVSPANGATSVATTGSITITFSESMDTSAAGSVTLNSGTPLSGGTWSNANKTYTVGYSGLTKNTLYNIGISGFKDTAGNSMDAVTTGYSFTTSASITQTGTNPQTGDSSQMWFAVVAGIAALSLLILIVSLRKKKKA